LTRPAAGAAVVLLASCLGGCAHAPLLPGAVEEGLASFYGRHHHGRATASGERFDMYALTAAHRTLRFGSLVEVENLRNGRLVQVRINDRGPFRRGRIIDLSYAAAQKLDMIRAGLVPVRMQVLRTGP
jgi:rare lipoprotein A